MRIYSPYVALPFDPGRVRPELVGLLLHPVSRSETWRRLGTPRTLLRSSQGFHSKDAGRGSWRAWRGQAQSRKTAAAIAWRTCPRLLGRADFEETEQRFDTR